MEEKEHGSPTCYTYDAAGNRIGKKTPEQVTRYSYNGKDQLIEEAWDTGKNIFTYDCQGSILEIAGAEGSRRFTYDSKDQRCKLDIPLLAAGHKICYNLWKETYKMNVKNESIIKPLPDDLLITEKEKKWRVKLPRSYREFLKKFNGCIPQENCFHHRDHEFVIVRFLGIVGELSNREIGWYDIGVVESQIGERLTDNMDLIGIEILPIAELFAGDYLCLDLRNSKGSVCIWFHEGSEEFKPVIEKVVDSFEEFLAKLR